MKTNTIIFMRNFVALLSYIFLTCGVISCVTDSYDNRKDEPEPEIEQEVSYEEFSENLDNLLSREDILSNDDLIRALMSLPGYKSHSEEDGFITIATTDGHRIGLDIFSPEQEDSENIDLTDLENDLTDIMNQMNGVGGMQKSVVSDGFDDTTLKSRSSENNNVSLSRRSVYLWSPLDHFLRDGAKQDYEKIAEMCKVRKLIKKFDFAYGKDCRVSDLTNFRLYDVVILITHGTPSGEPILAPEAFPSGSLQQLIASGDVYETRVPDYNSPRLDKQGRQLVDKEGKRLFNSARTYALRRNKISSYFLDGSLRYTLLWTTMCHAGKKDGALLAAFSNAGGAMFCGSNQVTTKTIPVSTFKRFAIPFFTGKVATQCFGGTDEYRLFLCNVDELFYYYPGVKAPSNAGNPRTTYAAPKSMLDRRGRQTAQVTSRAVSSESGVAFRKSDETAIRYIPYSQLPLVSYDCEAILDGEVGLATIEVDASSLPKGEYDYWSYTMEDGRYVLSDYYSHWVNEDSNIYYIYTPRDYENFMGSFYSYDPSVYRSHEVQLMNDIDISYISGSASQGPFVPAAADRCYNGTFHGNGHTIRMRPHSGSILSSIGETGVLKDVNFEIRPFNGDNYGQASVVENNFGRIENCRFDIETFDVGVHYDSNLISQNYGVVENCQLILKGNFEIVPCLVNFNGDVRRESFSNISVSNENAQIKNCKVYYNDIKAAQFYGISQFNYAQIIDCEVTGNTKSGRFVLPDDIIRCAGITRSNYKMVSGCRCILDVSLTINEVPFTSSEKVDFGGISTFNYGLIDNCRFEGNITVTDVSKENLRYSSSSCDPTWVGSVYSGGRIGGISACNGETENITVSYDQTIVEVGTIRNCTSKGKLLGCDRYNGGIVGINYRGSTVSGCANYMSLRWQPSAYNALDERNLDVRTYGHCDGLKNCPSCICINQISGYSEGVERDCSKHGSISFPKDYDVWSEGVSTFVERTKNSN